MFPSLPPWEAVHPALVHFPIGILVIAPLLMILAAVWRKARLPLAVAGLVVLLAGTIGAQLAVMSGEAAADVVPEHSEAVAELIHEHEELAETARTLFAVLTFCYAMIVLLAAKLRERLKAGVWEVQHFLMVIAVLAGLGVLYNAAEYGGYLVHHHGIHAPLPPMDHDHGDHRHD
jgi:uncharacterized membrane protein